MSKFFVLQRMKLSFPNTEKEKKEAFFFLFNAGNDSNLGPQNSLEKWKAEFLHQRRVIYYLGLKRAIQPRFCLITL